ETLESFTGVPPGIPVLMRRPPPRSPLLPYTTLFRSEVRVHGVAPVSVDDAGIEAGTQDGGDACCTAGIATLPLVVLVPRRRFAHFGGIFVDGSVKIRSAGFNARLQNRHVQKRRAHVD